LEISIHPKSKKIEIEIPEEFINKDLKIEIKPASILDELAGSLKVSKKDVNYDLEKRAWEMAVLEKYGKHNDKN
jgi:hypothetical protein